MIWTFPAPLCLFVRATIRREKYAAFKELARQVAFAYRQHPARLEWSAYATVAGPSLGVYIIVPLDSLGAMDDMASLDKVMADVYGDEGAIRLGEFQDCVLDMNTSVLNRIDLGLAPVPPRDAPAEYLYYLNVKVAPAAAGRFVDRAREAAAAMTSGPFALYGTFAGATRVHGFAPGERIADLELVARLQGRIASGSPADDGERIWAGIHDTLQETETSILRHIGHDVRDDRR
ncbi:hypothetical protein GTH10_11500 [Burkholderia thailandensis]|uniref:hypothetical protein n=1 Tax=Burkholderia thailandensis TaxID=57975 RepID=UPI00148EE404|nr:hypothetical protein [Burkholderia thailandensis]NOK47983.1 hypothetical protein [Burkholderia thailandensis]